MHEFRFLCLAVSRRDSGNCIAGFDIDSGNWLRPIRSPGWAAFADADLIVRDSHTHEPRFMALYDLLAIPLQEHAATNSQPENWVIDPSFLDNPPTVLRRCTGRRTVQFLLAHLDQGDTLLHSSGDSLAATELSQHRLSHSLSLIQPLDLTWKVSPNANHPGKVQVRAAFRFGKSAYNLVVTDPVWESKCQRAGMGSHRHLNAATPGREQVLLTVSLAAVPFHGLHYKLVAGVLELPRFDGGAAFSLAE